MTRRYFSISLQLLAELFMTGTVHHFRIKSGLPADAKIIDVKFDGWKRTAEVLFESESLEPTEEGKVIPGIDVVVERATP